MTDNTKDIDTSDIDTSTLTPFQVEFLETALWATTDESDDSGGEPLDANYTIHDFSQGALRELIGDCESFVELHPDLLEQAYKHPSYSPGEAGQDFWLTRNGHGAGFWDRGLGTIGNELSKASKVFGSVDLYVGDDGKIHC